MKKIIINENQFNLLFERLTSVLYHFTSIMSLYKILRDDKFVLSTDIEDFESYHPYNHFFMSFTRQKNGKQGYSAGHHVRVYVDGDKLNQRFAGKPVDYLNAKPRNHRGYVQRDTENEDRLFAKRCIISNAKSYITRIDIYVPNKDLYPLIYHILQMFDNVYVYDNEDSFNRYGNDIINSQILEEIQDASIPEDKKASVQNIVKDIATLLYYVSNQFKDATIVDLLKRFDLDEYTNDVIQYYAQLEITKNINFFASNSMAYLRSMSPDVYDKATQMIYYAKKNNIK